MNFDISIVTLLIFWMNEYPIFILLAFLPILAFILSIMTCRVIFELEDRVNVRKKVRFCKLFCGWLSLAYITTSGTYLQLVQHESLAEIPMNSDIINIYKDFYAFSVLLFILFVVCWWEEKTTKPILKNQNWKYRESLRPIIRIGWKIILVFFAFIFTVNFLESEKYQVLVLGSSILIVLLFYQILSKAFYFVIFRSPNEYEIQRVLSNITPIIIGFILLIYNHSLLDTIIKAISLPIFSAILAIISIVLTWFAIRGITFNKAYQLNPNLRSLASYPIAIQLKDKSSLNRQQIYDAIINLCPNCQIYFEQTSRGFRDNKAEIIVVDWVEYEEKNFENQRNELHIKIIEALTTKVEESKKCQELEVLNFIIERRHDGQIENVTPIENKIIMDYLKLIESSCLLVQKVCKSFFNTKIGSLFSTQVKQEDKAI